MFLPAFGSDCLVVSHLDSPLNSAILPRQSPAGWTILIICLPLEVCIPRFFPFRDHAGNGGVFRIHHCHYVCQIFSFQLLSQRLFIPCFCWFPSSSAYLLTLSGFAASWECYFNSYALPLTLAFGSGYHVSRFRLSRLIPRFSVGKLIRYRPG